MCFVWFWEQTAIISLYNLNWLVFITEAECVYCAVRWVLKYNFHLKTITALSIYHAMERHIIELWFENIWKEIAIDQADVWPRNSPWINEENLENIITIVCSDEHCDRALPKYKPACMLEVSSGLFNDAIPVCASKYGGRTLLRKGWSHKIIWPITSCTTLKMSCSMK